MGKIKGFFLWIADAVFETLICLTGEDDDEEWGVFPQEESGTCYLCGDEVEDSRPKDEMIVCDDCRGA